MIKNVEAQIEDASINPEQQYTNKVADVRLCDNVYSEYTTEYSCVNTDNKY